MPSISRTVLTRASPHNGDIADITWPAAVDPIQSACEQIRRNLLTCCFNALLRISRSILEIQAGLFGGLVRVHPKARFNALWGGSSKFVCDRNPVCLGPNR
jgi:hypothetical protein